MVLLMADTKGTPSNDSELYDYDDKNNNNDGVFEFGSLQTPRAVQIETVESFFRVVCPVLEVFGKQKGPFCVCWQETAVNESCDAFGAMD